MIASGGLEALSLREVARRLGISHQAPYKHFSSRDHLLAEVIRRCLKDFADALRSSAFDEAGHPRTAEDAMRTLGFVYLDYAARHPLQYRLMFGTPWPAVAHDIGLAEDARAAFDVLRARLNAIRKRDDHTLDLDAMFVWSSIHGIASVVESEAMRHLNFSADKAQEAVLHAVSMIDRIVFDDQRT